MDTTTPQIAKVLFINTGTNPIEKERKDLSLATPADKEVAKKVILEALNRMGKAAHALVLVGTKYYVADHKALRGESTDYFTTSVNYHPYKSELV